VSWIGYDQPRSLGKDETGGKAALPIWIHYMATALKGIPDEPYTIPDGVMTVKVDALTGTLAEEDEEGIYEYFYQENPPPVMQRDLPPMEDPSDSGYPDNGFPNSMSDNPLQPQPPDLNSAPAPAPAPQNNTSRDEADAVTRALNPSGF
jgi:penicillin-binding protein 1A